MNESLKPQHSDNSEALLYNLDSRGVATVTSNRPEKHNAFDDSMITVFNKYIMEIKNNPDVRVCVLRANGDNFCSGADVNWMQKMATYSTQKNEEDALKLGQLMHSIYNLGKPTVALVQGAAFGGGAGLIAACQMVIAAQDAHFCFPEVKLGLTPAIVSPFIINAIGARRAKAYFLSAEVFDAARALEMGLIHDVVPNEKLHERGEKLVKTLLSNGPQALEVTHKLVESLNTMHLTPDVLRQTANRIAAIRASSEGMEGLTAFLEKRKPNWIKNIE